MIEIGIALSIFAFGYVLGLNKGHRQGALVRTTREYIDKRDALLTRIETSNRAG